MNPKCNGCGCDADICECDPPYTSFARLDDAGHDQETEHGPCDDKSCGRCYPAASYAPAEF